MPIDSKQSQTGDALLAEIGEELSNLEGAELEGFLIEVGEQPDHLLQQHEVAFAGAVAALGRSRLEAARLKLRETKTPDSSNVVALDIAGKRALFAAIKARTDQTGEMTIAARNQKIDTEADLDSFLEACLRLGVIDEDGKLID